MNFAYPETAIVLRAPLIEDRYGNEVRDWVNQERIESDGWAFAPRFSDEASDAGRQGVIVGLTGLGPPGADVLATDRMEVRGLTYEVEGEPGEWRNPFTGWLPGIQVALKRVEG
ncbi:MAG TPA: hypothetical protein VFX60_06060 [Micromonospora sp.]|nr:hypothetical protein [Micromonospora sp.]